MAKLLGRLVALVEWWAVCLLAAMVALVCIAVFFRYRRTDPRLAPSWRWDVCLWLALVSIAAVAVYAVPYTARNKVWPLIESWFSA